MRRVGLKRGEKSFAKNVAVFMSGRSVASAITFLLTPVISRLYAPEHFGMAAFFLATVVLVAKSSNGGYEKAVNVARTDEEARLLLALCFALAVLTSAMTLPILVGLRFAQVLPSALASLGPLVWLMPIAVLVEALTLGSGAWLLRHKQYKTLAGAEVVQTGLRSGSRVASGFAFGSLPSALIWSYVGATAAKLLVIRSVISRAVPTGPILAHATNLRTMRKVAREYSDFPRYNLVTGLLMQVTSQLPIFVFGAAFGAEVVGFFAMADRVVRAPISITSNALRMAVLQKLSEIWNAGRPIRSQLLRTVGALCLLGVVPLVIFWSSGELLLGFILGDRWTTAGRFIEIMAPYFAVSFLGAPFAAATSAMRRQRLWFWLEVVTAIARLGVIPAAALPGATPESVLTYYVWATICTKLVAYTVVTVQTPSKHPGFPDQRQA